MSSSTAPTHYLAFDLGASSGRAMLGTLTAGTLTLEEMHRFETPLRDEGERLSWDLEALWGQLQHALAEALRAAPDLRSLSVDSWAIDYVPLGASGRPLRDPYAYRDPRTDGYIDEAFQVVPAPHIYEITGTQFLPFNTLYQILADQEQHPDLHAQTATHLTIADYFNYRLSRRAVMDQSMASTTQLMNVHTFEWSAELMKVFGIGAGAWPEIVPCGTRLGSLTPDAWPDDLAHSAPARGANIDVVASCSHDTACAVAAVPAEPSSNWAYVSCGTWSLLGAERVAPVVTEDAHRAGFTNEVGLDGTIRFLKNLTGLWVLQECMRGWRSGGESVTYDEVHTEAQAAPSGLARIDLEDDRFLGRGQMEHRLKSYCRETDQAVPETRGQLARVILESIADSYRRALHDLETITGQSVDVLHLVGGGAQNSLLCQLTADACSCSVVSGPVEATALGNVAVQARAMGDLPEGASVRDVVRRSTDPIAYAPDTAPDPTAA